MREIRFACQAGCTKCCREGGFVYLTKVDLRTTARFLGLRVQAFERRYVYRTRHLLRLRKPPGAACPFLEENGCLIHPAKPTQCRAYPFWPELVESVKTWRAAERVCPGLGKGNLIPLGTAMEIAQTMRDGYPTMY
jgi:uncharacterized protein